MDEDESEEAIDRLLAELGLHLPDPDDADPDDATAPRLDDDDWN